jgi:hypothetical protein
MSVLEGTLVERVYSEADASVRRIQRLSRGRSRSFAPDHLHSVWNESSRDAWSVHLYAPRLVSMRFYTTQPTGALDVSHVETAGVWS